MAEDDGATGEPLRLADEEDLPRRPAATEAREQEVRRRHVLYIPGYDPRDPGLYRRLAAFELRRFARLWGAKVDVDKEHVDDPAVPSVSWSARVEAGEARVEVTYETLRWDDIVARDFADPLPLRVLRAFRTMAGVFVTGLMWRIARASPWCAVAWAYPIAVLLLSLTLGIGLGIGAWMLGDAWDLAGVGATMALFLALATPVAVMAIVGRWSNFLLHLMDDGASQRSYAMRLDPVMQARIDAFAARIRAIMSDVGLDELLIVGHSSGSFMGIDALARLYEADPEFGKGKPAIALLTVGASELLVAMHPAAGWFRDRLKRIAIEPSVFWAEVVAPWDMLNFPHRSPVEELKLDVPADCPNPTFRRAFLTKMLKAESIEKLRRERNIFRVHFQFIMANEVRGPFDYFSLVCGPWRAKTQFRRTAKGAYMSPFRGVPEYPPPKETAAA